MNLKQISLLLENRKGSLSRPLKVLADAGIGITTLTMADTSDFGVLRIIVREWEKAVDLLKKNGFAAAVTDVTAIAVEDVPGGLLKTVDLMTELDLNVEYMYAGVVGDTGMAMLIFRFEHADVAAAKLAACGKCRIISEQEFFAE